MNGLARIQMGGLEYSAHASAIEVRRCLLPGIDRVDCSLPASVDLDASPGADLAVSLDGGDGEVRCFAGRVSAISRATDHTRVVGHSGARSLARSRPVLTEEVQTADALIRDLADQAGVTVASASVGPQLSLFVVDGRQSALDAIVRLSRLYGADAWFDEDNHLHIAQRTLAPVPVHVLGHGRDLTGARSTTWSPDECARAVVGEGTGLPSGPDRHWSVDDFAAGAVPGASASQRRRAEPLVRTVADAQMASLGWAGRQQDVEAPVRVRTWLSPAIAPGEVLELRDLPEPLGLGQIRVTQVRHRLHGSRGGESVIDGAALSGGAAAGIGGLLSLAGGLL